MKLNKTQIKDIINQEIEWHIKNKDKSTMPEDWVNGFIAVLKQLKKIFTILK